MYFILFKLKRNNNIGEAGAKHISESLSKLT